MIADTGGGGSASGATWMDVDAVEALAARLSAAGSDLDCAGGLAPRGGDFGLAGPLIADMMASVLDAGARCAAEGIHLADLVDQSREAWVGIDAAAAESFGEWSGP